LTLGETGVLARQRFLDRTHPVGFILARDFSHPADLLTRVLHLRFQQHGAFDEMRMHRVHVEV
jgi:hypothetical protein